MPLADYSSYDPDFSAAQVAECKRIIDGLRAISEKVVRLSGSVEELSAVADRTASLSSALDTVTQRRAMETFRYRFDTDAPNDVMPFNPATGAFNPMAPNLDMRIEGETLVADVAFPSHYESAPDTVQGGIVAACFDQLLAFAVMLHGKTGPTTSLTTRFLKRTPINEPLRFEAWVEAVDGEKYLVRGRCIHGEVSVSEAEAQVLGRVPIPVVAGSQR